MVSNEAKIRAGKFIRNTVISVVALLIIAIGAGVAYTWYIGQQSAEDPAAFAPPAEPEPTPVVQHTVQSPDAPASVSVQSITSPVAPGSNASITIRTNQLADCTIAVVYDKVESKDSGLAPKVADDYGMVTWTWTVEKTVPLGTWPVKIICIYYDKSAVVKADLQVAEKTD